jgi:succinate dehydrogenase / fumarate reductase, cytochrome b subunit
VARAPHPVRVQLGLIQHLLGGLRHLMWDTGRGLDLPTVFRSAWAVVAGAIGLDVLLWIIGFLVA